MVMLLRNTLKSDSIVMSLTVFRYLQSLPYYLQPRFSLSKGYVIERRDAKRTSWSSAGNTACLEYQVTKLMENNEYVFRVAAENQIGVSEFVETSGPVKAKFSFGKILFSFLILGHSPLKFVVSGYIEGLLRYVIFKWY